MLAPGGLTWLTALGSRSSQAVATAGILDAFRGVLVRDDYAGYRQFDPQLVGVQVCCAHLARQAQGVADLGPEQHWADRVQTILAQANTARDDAIANGAHSLHPEALAKLRDAYHTAVTDGLATNTNRPWHDGRHPGWRLAKRLHDKADQIWLFTTGFDVPFTSNSAEQAPPDEQSPPKDQRLLAHPDHPQPLVPHPLLPVARRSFWTGWRHRRRAFPSDAPVAV